MKLFSKRNSLVWIFIVITIVFITLYLEDHVLRYSSKIHRAPAARHTNRLTSVRTATDHRAGKTPSRQFEENHEGNMSKHKTIHANANGTVNASKAPAIWNVSSNKLPRRIPPIYTVNRQETSQFSTTGQPRSANRIETSQFKSSTEQPGSLNRLQASQSGRPTSRPAHTKQPISGRLETAFMQPAAVSTPATNTVKPSDAQAFETCAALSQGTKQDYRRVEDHTTDQQVVKSLEKGCQTFKTRYRFPTPKEENLIDEEAEFPIAYSLVVHKNIHQVSMLLSAIYRKHNFYCVHVDSKSDRKAKRAVELIANCFDNIFKSSKSERVVYASFYRLQADINCMKDLLAIKTKTNWKYLINICGQDFPLRTNLEIVQQLRALRGKNSIGSTTDIDKHVRKRFQYIHRVQNVTNKQGAVVEEVVNTKIENAPPPFNMTIVKNSAYNVFTREFLQWALQDSVKGAALLQWSKMIYSPDENYWSMLNVLPRAPGGSTFISMWRISHLVLWSFSGDKCHGHWQRNTCVFGGKDLPWLVKMSRLRLFANKFDSSYDVTPITCLRHHLDERTSGRYSPHNAYINPLQIPKEFLK